MSSFDKPVKYLIELAPDEFTSFVLGTPIRVIHRIDARLKSRNRHVDDCYLVESQGQQWICHLEYHRRKQAVAELAVDIAEAQCRIRRRDGLPVLTLVLDLYGKQSGLWLEPQQYAFGCEGFGIASTSAFYRVNLRAQTTAYLLANAPPVLWPLAPLTSDGRLEPSLRLSRSTIRASERLSEQQRLDFEAILYTVADAEQVKYNLLSSIFVKEILMRSTFYNQTVKSARKKGFDEGRNEGRNAQQDVLLSLLQDRFGNVPLELTNRVQAAPVERLMEWTRRILKIDSPEALLREPSS